MEYYETDDCPKCGQFAKYFPCPDCGEDGGSYPYEDFPLEYDPDEFEVCEMCSGVGGWWVCANCPKPSLEVLVYHSSSSEAHRPVDGDDR